MAYELDKLPDLIFTPQKFRFSWSWDWLLDGQKVKVLVREDDYPTIKTSSMQRLIRQECKKRGHSYQSRVGKDDRGREILYVQAVAGEIHPSKRPHKDSLLPVTTLEIPHNPEENDR